MNSSEATRTLAEATAGDGPASEHLWTLLYDELQSMAHRELASERDGLTLSTTELIHEAWFKLVGHERTASRDRGYFYAMACRAMRQVLVDHARSRKALKRGGRWRRVTLDDAAGAVDPGTDDLVALDEALSRLSEYNERLGRVVELRYFGGLQTEQVAALLDVDARTVERDWHRARAYLYRMLEIGTS